MSDFGKEVADVFRDMKRQFETRPIIERGQQTVPAGAVDRSVREQVISDLEGIIGKHDGK